MNYLAHALLSPKDPEILMGNLWGDLLRPRDYQLLSPGIIEGIRRHKQIDAYTDRHKSVEAMMKVLRPQQGKYTPVVVDVLMDFILSKYWDNYHPEPIEAFCRHNYGVVSAHISGIPERLHPRINRMLSHHWLESCKSRERMEQTLRMLGKRAAFENTIPEAMIPYDLHQQQMDELFSVFFADMQEYLILQSEG